MIRVLLLLSMLPSLGACVTTTEIATQPIGDVQGPSGQSPLLGQIVIVEGIVVGGSIDGLGGVFIQDPRGDDDPHTSEGLFIELRSGSTEPDRNERVRAVGTVAELGENTSTLTALIETRVESLGRGPAPEPVSLNGPPADGDWERFEGMAVTISAPLTVSGTRNMVRFGEITSSFDGRLFTPTEVASPGAEARTVQQDNVRRQLLLDDGELGELTSFAWYLPPGMLAQRPLRTGSVITGASGVVDQRRGEYRLQLTGSLEGRIEQMPRPQRPSVPGDVRVASLNLLNLFNGDGNGGGFPTPRGSETFEQYERQQRRLVAVVQSLAPDVAAVMEIENDGYGPESALSQFVDVLNTTGPITDYAFVITREAPGTDQIRVALIYRASRLQTIGDPALLNGGPFARYSRVPVAQAFRFGEGPPFVIVANHFKSKSCGRGDSAGSGVDADQGDGQGCWNTVRVDSAKRIDAWLRTDPTGAGTNLYVLLGDLNAYKMEDPIRTLLGAGWRDAFSVSNAERPYSYVYDSQAGRLDHALLSADMASYLRGAAEWHINSDELPESSYYRLDDGPYRSSDHDPLLLGFDFGR